MTCVICHEDILEDLFSAHRDKKHLFHTSCISSWILSDPESQVTCPLCRMAMDGTRELLDDPFIGDRVAFELLWAGDTESTKWALENCYFFLEERYDALYELAELGNIESFELIFSTFKHHQIICDKIDLCIRLALKHDRLDFVKLLFEKGIVQIFDIGFGRWDSFGFVVAKGKQESAEFLLSSGVTIFSGPRNENWIVADALSELISEWFDEQNVFILKLLHEYGFLKVICELTNGRFICKAMEYDCQVYLDLLIENVIYVCGCESGCSDFIDSVSLQKLKCIKWFIETAKCSNRDTWKKVKEAAYAKGWDECYYYMCESLGESGVEMTEIKLIYALQSDSLDPLNQFVKSNADITGFFPRFSEKVQNIKMFKILTENGCRVQPNVRLFTDALKCNEIEMVEVLVEAGLKINEALLDSYLNNIYMMDGNARDFDVFLKYGVSMWGNKKVWNRVIISQDSKALTYLVKNSTKAWILNNVEIFRHIFNVDKLKHISFFILDLLLESNTSLFYEVLERGLSLPVLEVVKKYKSLDHERLTSIVLGSHSIDKVDIQVEFFGNIMNLSQDLSQGSIGSILQRLMTPALLPFLSRLDSYGVQYSHQKVAEMIALKPSISMNFMKKYSEFIEDWAKILEFAILANNWSIIRYILPMYRDELELHLSILSEFKIRSGKHRKTLSVLAKFHCRQCDLCSDLEREIPVGEPELLRFSIISKHGASHNYDE